MVRLERFGRIWQPLSVWLQNIPSWPIAVTCDVTGRSNLRFSTAGRQVQQPSPEPMIGSERFKRHLIAPVFRTSTHTRLTFSRVTFDVTCRSKGQVGLVSVLDSFLRNYWSDLKDANVIRQPLFVWSQNIPSWAISVTCNVTGSTYDVIFDSTWSVKARRLF